MSCSSRGPVPSRCSPRVSGVRSINSARVLAAALLAATAAGCGHAPEVRLPRFRRADGCGGPTTRTARCDRRRRHAGAGSPAGRYPTGRRRSPRAVEPQLRQLARCRAIGHRANPCASGPGASGPSEPDPSAAAVRTSAARQSAGLGSSPRSGGRHSCRVSTADGVGRADVLRLPRLERWHETACLAVA